MKIPRNVIISTALLIVAVGLSFFMPWRDGALEMSGTAQNGAVAAVPNGGDQPASSVEVGSVDLPSVDPSGTVPLSDQPPAGEPVTPPAAGGDSQPIVSPPAPKPVPEPPPPPPKKTVPKTLILYYGDGCPHCLIVEAYIDANADVASLGIVQKEVYYNDGNAQELQRRAVVCGLPSDRIGVPFLWNGSECRSGDRDIMDYLDEIRL